jgi:hypothetical protein
MRYEIGGLLVCLVAILACGSSAFHTRIAPETYAITCKKEQIACYRKAVEVCPAGFDILDSSGKQGAVVTHHTATKTSVVHPTYSGEMLVRCQAKTAKK